MISRPLSPEQRSSLAEAAAQYAAQVSQVDAYLQGRGFDPSTTTAHQLGFVLSPALPEHDGREGRLAIPYIGPKGNVYNMRFRCLADHSCKDEKCPKYLGVSHIKNKLYNIGAVLRATEVVAIVEGELDALSVEAAGIPCVGVPGVNSWQPYHWRLFEGIPKVLIVGDNDPAGQGFVDKVLRDVVSARPVTLDPAVNDLNELLVKEGVDGVRRQLGLE